LTLELDALLCLIEALVDEIVLDLVNLIDLLVVLAVGVDWLFSA